MHDGVCSQVVDRDFDQRFEENGQCVGERNERLHSQMQNTASDAIFPFQDKHSNMEKYSNARMLVMFEALAEASAQAAAARPGEMLVTPLQHSASLSKALDCRLLLKCEHLQTT